ncbi:MAG: glycosyltransferase family 4 protein [Acidobacteriota bacterium]|nr:glycosyltransferase family 4 protein [Acidobacteriota bacterium]
MKLLVYSHYFAPSVGGVETIVMSLADGLAALRLPDGAPRFEITLITNTPSGEFDDAALPFSVIRQPGFLRLAGLIWHCDVLHVAGPALLPLLLGYLFRKPVVLEHHGYQAVCPNGLLLHQPDRVVCPGYFQAHEYSKCVSCQASEMSRAKAIAHLLMMFPRQFLVRRVAANIAVSKHVERRVDVPRTTRILHGIETSLTRSSADAPGASPDKIQFAYVGRFVAEKGISTILEAVSLLKRRQDFQLRLIGDGPLRGELQNLISARQLQGCVQITGFLRGSDLAKALNEVSVVVIPTIMEETAGLAAMEQMMRGRLVIASAIGGLGETVGEGGLLFPPGDAEALASCMNRILEDRALLDAIGAKARQRAVTLFSRERMIQNHACLYAGLIPEHVKNSRTAEPIT